MCHVRVTLLRIQSSEWSFKAVAEAVGERDDVSGWGQAVRANRSSRNVVISIVRLGRMSQC